MLAGIAVQPAMTNPVSCHFSASAVVQYGLTHLHPALSLMLSSRSCNLVGESFKFPHQVYFKPLILCMLVGATAQPDMTHLQFSTCGWVMQLSLAQPIPCPGSHGNW